MDGWMDRWMNGQMDKWMDGLINEWKDGWISWLKYYIEFGWCSFCINYNNNISIEVNGILEITGHLLEKNPYVWSIRKYTESEQAEDLCRIWYM